MSTKTVTLTITERASATKILDAFKGSLSQLSTLMDDLKKLVISDEEWKSAGLVVKQVISPEGTPTGQETWQWNDATKDGVSLDKEIELESETVSYLTNEIKKRSDAGELTLQDKPLISLNQKLQ